MRPSRNFTLVELLMIITIILILAGMLLPALNKAKQSAYRISCLSKIKQFNQAFGLYAGDNQDYVAPAMEGSSWGYVDSATKAGKMIHYLVPKRYNSAKNATDMSYVPVNFMRCPDDDSRKPLMENRAELFSYGYSNIMGLSDDLQGDSLKKTYCQYKKLSQFQYPSSGLTFADMNNSGVSYINGTPNNYAFVYMQSAVFNYASSFPNQFNIYAGWRHGKLANWGHIDGSAISEGFFYFQSRYNSLEEKYKMMGLKF